MRFGNKNKMGKRVIYLALLLHTALVSVTAYVNGYDEPFDFRCPSSQIISSISSIHNNGAQDRVWDFTCRTVAAASSCTMSGYVNDWDELLVYRCPEQTVLTGMASYHDNGPEDRRFQFQCCKIGTVSPKFCYVSPFVNAWDGPLTLRVPEGQAIKGAYSCHDNVKEDRRWRFELCHI